MIEVIFDDGGRAGRLPLPGGQPGVRAADRARRRGRPDAMREIAPAPRGALVRDLRPRRADRRAGAVRGRRPSRWAAGSTCTPSASDDPAERQVAILFKDVTEAKRVEAALRESERRFRDMADTAPAMLWVTEPDGYCSFLSRGWYEFTGQTPATGLGFGWADAAHPDDAARRARRVRRGQRGARAVRGRLPRPPRRRRVPLGDRRRPPAVRARRGVPRVHRLGHRHHRPQARRRTSCATARPGSQARRRDRGRWARSRSTCSPTPSRSTSPAARSTAGRADEPLTFAKVQAHFHPDDRETG